MISGVSDEHPSPPPSTHLAGGTLFWAGGAVIVWCMEATLRLTWGDPPPGPGRFGVIGLLYYTATGSVLGLTASIFLLPLVFHCRRWQKPLRLYALQAALVLFGAIALFRFPLAGPPEPKDKTVLFLLPPSTGKLLFNLGWFTLAAVAALIAYWLLFRPLSQRPVGGYSHRMLALMPLLFAPGLVLTGTAKWEGPESLLFPALIWGGAGSLLLATVAGLIRRAQLWRTGVPERVGSAMPAIAALLVMLLAVLAATGWSPRPYDPGAMIPGEPRAEDGAAADRPNILLISVDTLRADHLGCYDYTRPTSPNIDRLAGEGILFEQMVCPLPRTVPALASMLTGLYPQDHGLRDNLRESIYPETATLPEKLREAGYHTFAMSANGLIHPTRGLHRGFDFFYAPAMEWARAPFLRTLYERLVDPDLVPGERGSRNHFEDGPIFSRRANQLLRDLARLPDGEPFFFWAHYYDPHMVYGPPPPWHQKFGPPNNGPYHQSLHYNLVSKGYMIFRCNLPEEDRMRGVDLYDGEIGYSDQLVGQLLQILEEEGMMDETIVVFTSDHGESLGEHDFYFDHGDFLYEPSMRIPLIFRLPGGTGGGRRVTRQVQLLDLMPTLLDLVGGETLPLPPSGYGGRSLLQLLDGTVPPGTPERPAFGESGYCFYPKLNDRLLIKPLGKTRRGREQTSEEKKRLAETGLQGRLRMIRRDGWKLILTPAPVGDDRLELYNLLDDPEELHNLAEVESERVEPMLAELRQWMAADQGQQENREIEVSEDSINRLKSLGYIQ